MITQGSGSQPDRVVLCGLASQASLLSAKISTYGEYLYLLEAQLSEGKREKSGCDREKKIWMLHQERLTALLNFSPQRGKQSKCLSEIVAS